MAVLAFGGGKRPLSLVQHLVEPGVFRGRDLGLHLRGRELALVPLQLLADDLAHRLDRVPLVVDPETQLVPVRRWRWRLLLLLLLWGRYRARPAFPTLKTTCVSLLLLLLLLLLAGAAAAAAAAAAVAGTPSDHHLSVSISIVVVVDEQESVDVGAEEGEAEGVEGADGQLLRLRGRDELCDPGAHLRGLMYACVEKDGQDTVDHTHVHVF